MGDRQEKTRLVNMQASADMAHGLTGSGSLALLSPSHSPATAKADDDDRARPRPQQVQETSTLSSHMFRQVYTLGNRY